MIKFIQYRFHCILKNCLCISEPKEAGSEHQVQDKIRLEPLPTVSSLMKKPSPTPNPIEQMTGHSSFGAKLRRLSSFNSQEGEDGVPLRNAIHNKLKRLSGSFGRADKNENRKAQIPSNLEIDFSKPFDFDGAVDENAAAKVGFSNPLFGQQPSRMSMQFDDLPSPLDFGVSGFEAGSSSDSTPVTPNNLDIFLGGPFAEPKIFPVIKKETSPIGGETIEVHVADVHNLKEVAIPADDSQSEDDDDDDYKPTSTNNFFDDEPFSTLDSSSFPNIIRKKPDSSPTGNDDAKKKKVSWSENVGDSLPAGDFAELDIGVGGGADSDSQTGAWQSPMDNITGIFPNIDTQPQQQETLVQLNWGD